MSTSNQHQESFTQKPKMGAPKLGFVTPPLVRKALELGWADLRSAPQFGLVFAGVYVFFGWFLAWITFQTGATHWLVLATLGFPLLGSFAAVGLYEVSRRMQTGQPLSWNGILWVVMQQRNRSLPMIGTIVVIILLFWFSIGHMIFALFMGLSTMTDVSNSFSVFLTPNGLSMLAVGTLIGAIFALLIYMVTVLGLPMVLDREIDFITAIVTSLSYVISHPMTMIGWGAFIAAITLVSLIPIFLGLFIVLPLLGHATWHLYSLLIINDDVEHAEAVS